MRPRADLEIGLCWGTIHKASLPETIEIAANLMNLGKMFVPKSLLTKTDALTEDERALIRDSLTASADRPSCR